MIEGTALDRAKARLVAARARLGGTVSALQTRLDPQTVARDAVEAVVDQGAKALQSGVESAKRNPVTIVGALGFAALILGRKRIVATVQKLRAPKSAKPAPRPRVRPSKPRLAPVKRISK